ncbi:MAG: c-type cytochrome, partial [Actinobacteria bacterium]|nr:c-type cytochrome [Actinomycetota bacterium]
MRRVLALLLLALPLFVAACGGGETTTPAPEDVQGTVPQETVAAGDAEAGKAVFDSASPGCGTCHTFKAAGSDGTTGPNLDESLKGKDAQYILESIVNPDAEITEGFTA